MQDLQARWAGWEQGQLKNQNSWQQSQSLASAPDTSQDLSNQDLYTYIVMVHRDLDVIKQALRETKEKLDQSEMSDSALKENMIWQNGLIWQLFTQNTNLQIIVSNLQKAQQHSLTSSIPSLASSAPLTVSAPVVPSDHSEVHHATPKINLPKVFSGKPRDVETFLVSILDVIELLRRTLATNCERSLYMGTALGEGSTQTWYVSICTNEPNLLDNFEEFVKHFRKHFTYVDVKHDTMHKIKIMGQDTYSACSQFYTQFKSQLRYLHILDSTKISLFMMCSNLKSRTPFWQSPNILRFGMNLLNSVFQ